MKSRQINTWKLGLFVTLGLAAFAAALWWLGVSRFDKETFTLVTYIDESVQGLDVGAPVKMRGVRIGNVSEIGFAPDGLTVEVHADLYVTKLESLGIGNLRRPDPNTGRFNFGDLRARVAMQGLTGVAFLAVDKLPNVKPEGLSFQVPPNYLPAAPSTLSRIEEGAVGIADKLPGIVENLDRVLSALAEDLDVRGLSGAARQLLDEMHAKVQAVDVETVQRDLLATLSEVRALVARGNGALVQFEGEPAPVERLVAAFESISRRIDEEFERGDLDGTTAELREASRALGQFARDLGLLSGEAYQDLVALREALTALRSLVLLLERNPSALVRGRENE